MKGIYVLLITLCLSSCTIADDPFVSLKGMLDRMEPGLSDKFSYELICPEKGKDVFEIEAVDGRVMLRGNSINSLAVGANWYLKYYVHSGNYWCGERVSLPDQLPLPKKKIKHTTPYCHRYYMNWCVNRYTTVNWDWARWEKEIDYMALNGVTIAFIQIDDRSVEDYLLEKYAGIKLSPTEQKYVNQRIALQQKVIQRMKELGVNPALEGFKGSIPQAVLAGRKDIKTGETHSYLQENKLPFIHPNDTFFKEYGNSFYERQKDLYGDLAFVTADPIIERNPPKDIPMDTLGLRVQELILEAYPNAIWTLMGWQADPRTELLNHTDPEHTLILDLWCEASPQWPHREIYKRTPWVWNVLNNFGGNTGIYGNLEQIFNTPREALSTEAGQYLCGLGMTMEGLETNPVISNALYESAWWNEIPNIEQWLSDYAFSRYGKRNIHADRAWSILNQTAYRATTVQQGPSENIMCARPSLTINRVSEWGTSKLYYDPQAFLLAWDELLAAGTELAGNDGYNYDLVDVTRQSLSNYALSLYPQIIKAYQTKNKQELSILKEEFLGLFDDMNDCLATHDMFLLGHWIDRAVSWASDEQHIPEAIIAAKTRISTWGDKDWSERVVLHDYSFREWEGIMKELYKSRWSHYLGILEKTIQTGMPDQTDWYEFDVAWNKNGHQYISTPVGNSYEVCKHIHDKYRVKMNRNK